MQPSVGLGLECRDLQVRQVKAELHVKHSEWHGLGFVI